MFNRDVSGFVLGCLGYRFIFVHRLVAQTSLSLSPGGAKASLERTLSVPVIWGSGIPRPKRQRFATEQVRIYHGPLTLDCPGRILKGYWD